MVTWRRCAAILVFNAALAFLIQAGAPDQPRLSDRAEYEYTGRQPFAANCPNTIYCYRILVPMLLEHVPLDAEMRWRATQWLAHTTTGTVTAVVTSSLPLTPAASPFIAASLLQTSYAFSFTAYDPYTPDPVVFLIAALILWAWMKDAPILAMALAACGVFAKETAGVIAACVAIAAMIGSGRQRRWRWLLPVGAAGIVLLGFHWYMDTYNGWGIARNPAASLSNGSWLALWFKNNPSHVRKALMLFSPFAFAWLFAVGGYRHVPVALRQLALGSILPIAALVYIQTPERALGNAFFVVIPMAAAFLAHSSPAAAWAAAITTGMITAKIGLSTTWLPSTTILLIPGTAAALWAFILYARNRDKIPST